MYKISIQSYYGILIHKRLFLNNNSHYGYLCNKSFYYKGGDIQLTKVLYTHLLKKSIPKIKK